MSETLAWKVGDRVTFVRKTGGPREHSYYHVVLSGTVTHVHVRVQVTWDDGHTEKYRAEQLQKETK